MMTGDNDPELRKAAKSGLAHYIKEGGDYCDYYVHKCAERLNDPELAKKAAEAGLDFKKKIPIPTKLAPYIKEVYEKYVEEVEKIPD